MLRISAVMSAVALLLVGCSQDHAVATKEVVAQKTYTAADVQRALRDAEDYLRAGKYEESLERHVWYHENALRYAPAQYGVRLSFALSDWADLATKYPKALDAIRAARDKAVEAYRSDHAEKDKLLEAMSIDFAIDDLPSAKALYYESKKNGDSDVVRIIEIDRIIDAGEVKWAKDIIGNPNDALDEIIAMRSMPGIGGSKARDFKADFDRMYSLQAARLIQAVAVTDGLDAARAVQKRALKELDTQEIRTALGRGPTP